MSVYNAPVRYKVSESGVSRLLIIILSLFFLSLASASVMIFIYYNKSNSSKSDKTDSAILGPRPIANTYELPQAKVGNKYQTFIFATVYGVDTQIEAKVFSGLPKGLQLMTCHMEFNSPTVKYSKVSSLAKCSLEGIPEQSGNYQVRILFSVPGGNINAEQDIPLLINP